MKIKYLKKLLNKKNIFHYRKLLAKFVKMIGPKNAAHFSYYSIDWGIQKSQKSVVCLDREIFNRDVMQLRRNGKYNYPLIKKGITFFQMVWLPKKCHIQTHYQKKLDSDSKGFYLCKLYALTLLNLISTKTNVIAVLSANIDYFQDAAFKWACKEKSIPFIVLCKEHPVDKKTKRDLFKYYQRADFIFDGQGIAVAGKDSKDIFLRKVKFNQKANIKITGLPRYDEYRFLRKKPEIKSDAITLLTFSRGYYADNTFRDVLKLFIHLAFLPEFRKTRFFIKTKDSVDNIFIKNILKGNIPKNLIITHEIQIKNLMMQSQAVIGYNSLSIIEAALVGKPIILPAWDQCKKSGNDVMLPKTDQKISKYLNYAPSPEEFKKLILLSLNGKIKKPKQGSHFGNNLLFFPKKELSSLLIENFIDELSEASQIQSQHN